MTTIDTADTFSGKVRANGLEIYVEQVGQGPDVLLIGGLGDTVESWQFQLDGLADGYRLTAFDNRGAGRTAMPKGRLSAESMADRCRGGPARARDPLGARRGVLGRQHHRPGARAAPSRQGPQPRAAEHVGRDSIAGARFEILEGEAHQPFQEVPDQCNALVDRFWREVEGLDTTNGAIS